MKHVLKTALVLCIVLSFVMGSIPLGTLLVCVHAEDASAEQTVHLHYGKLPGQPCDDAPERLQHEDHGDGRRHFLLATETVSRSQSTAARVSSHQTPSLLQAAAPVSDPFRGFRKCGISHENPSGFLDTSFILTTVLII